MKEAAENVFYAVLGAPVVAGRGIANTSGKMVSIAKNEYEAFASEGRRLAERLSKNSVVDEINSRVDLDGVQDRVDKLRDQMEELLANWRDSFTPESKKPKAKKVSKSTKKPASKKQTESPKAKADTKAEETKVEAEAAAEGAAPA